MPFALSICVLWRSHPFVTSFVIKSLPGYWQWSIVNSETGQCEARTPCHHLKNVGNFMISLAMNNLVQKRRKGPWSKKGHLQHPTSCFKIFPEKSWPRRRTMDNGLKVFVLCNVKWSASSSQLIMTSNAPLQDEKKRITKKKRKWRRKRDRTRHWWETKDATKLKQKKNKKQTKEKRWEIRLHSNSIESSVKKF